MRSPNLHITNEEHSFRKLLQQYHPLILSIISKKVNDRDDMKDVYQNIHIQLWLIREKLSNDNLEAIVVNTCKQKIVEYYRKNASQFNRTSLENITSLFEHESVDQEIKEEQLLNLEMAIENLIPPIRQKIFKMNKLEGITQEKIASQLNMPKRTVKYHVQESLLFLKNMFKSHKNS